MLNQVVSKTLTRPVRSFLRLQGPRLCTLSAQGRLPVERTRQQGAVVGDDYPELLRARRRRARWSDEDRRLYQRYRWRSEGFHGEAKTWHGLGRAIRRGLDNMKIQANLTSAAINLKRLAAALLAILWAIWTGEVVGQDPLCTRRGLTHRTSVRAAAAT